MSCAPEASCPAGTVQNGEHCDLVSVDAEFSALDDAGGVELLVPDALERMTNDGTSLDTETDGSPDAEHTTDDAEAPPDQDAEAETQPDAQAPGDDRGSSPPDSEQGAG